jgi:hypothetical protein
MRIEGCRVVKAAVPHGRILGFLDRPSPVAHRMWLRNSLPSLWYHSTDVKADAILWILWAPTTIFRTHPVQNVWQPNLSCDNVVQNSTRNLWKSHEILKLCSTVFLKFFGQHFECGKDRHSLQAVDHSALNNEHLFAHLWTFYTTVLQSSTYHILAANCE